MNLVRTLSILVVSFITLGCGGSGGRDTPENAVAEAIRLHEAKDYVTFVKNFAPPEVLKQLTERGTVEDFAKEYGHDKAARSLERLKAVKDLKPTIDGDQAMYLTKGADGSNIRVVLVKIGNLWYMGD